ncbi:hypothetical protein [Streptomyces huiliensis]|uniref:hypothetical protein n=1 Tax=Streptomyces huiliensis TaxID=2876027 RepID=UPI001CBA890C|nr:hypothetical protein [Streptomyces huiliensis]MBZ4318378.1 hypothetical protein [Streptomyces huiliensis]
MSFDLGFWWERQPISPAEAARKYGAMAEGGMGIAGEHGMLGTFYAQLTSRFPDLTEDNFEDSPWSSPLYRTRECVIASISRPRQSEIFETLLGIAADCGITCYDPQFGKVYFPQGGTSVTLELSNGLVVEGPDWGDVSQALRGLSPEDWYVILETSPGWFMQVGFGAAVGVPAGSYAVEVKEGAEDKHFRFVLNELPQVIDVFQRFLSGDSSWRSGVRFSRVSY